MAAANPTRRRATAWVLDAAAVAALATAAFLLRAAPIPTVSLWWDELVHAQTASQSGFLDVLRAAKLGIPPGFGNAGAVPLDYLLLHAWLQVAPAPPAEGIELYYRTPALLWSVLCVLATYLYGRRFFDRGFGLVAATILALSVPHALYAAEVRFYSLFALMTVVNLYAFAALVLGRERSAPWIVFTGIGLLYFFTGFMSLLVLLVQYVVLAGLAVADSARRSDARSPAGVVRLVAPVASGLVVLAAVGVYLHGTFLGVKYGRPVQGLRTWERVYTAFEFYSGQSPLLLVAFATGLVAVLVQGWRRGRHRFAIGCALAGSFLTLPVIVEIERWKEYYFHPRHAFFLLPTFAIVAAAGLLSTLHGLDPLRWTTTRDTTRDGAYAALSVLLIVATQAVPIARHLANPQQRFARTKTLRDFKALTQHLRDRVEALPPDRVYLLLAERGRPGHIGNPMLAKYLQWYGLANRVVLRGVDHPHDVRVDLARECPDGCAGRPAARVQKRLGAIGPFNARREMLDLVGVAAAPQTAAPVGAVGLLHYWRYLGGPPRHAPDFAVSTYRGISLFEKLAPARSPRTGDDPIGSLEAPGSVPP